MVKKLIITDNLSPDFLINNTQKKIRLNIKGKNGISVTRNSSGVIISNNNQNTNMIWKKVWSGNLSTTGSTINLLEPIKDKLFYLTVSLSTDPLGDTPERFARVNGICLAKPYPTSYHNYVNKYTGDDDSLEIQFIDDECRTLKINWTSNTRQRLKEVWVQTQG